MTTVVEGLYTSAMNPNQPDTNTTNIPEEDTSLRMAPLQMSETSSNEPALSLGVTSQKPYTPGLASSTIALILGGLSLIVMVWVLWTYLATFNSLSTSDFPDAGLVQGVALLFTGVVALGAAVVALVGYLIAKKPSTGLAHIAKRICGGVLWLYGIYFSLHTISLFVYLVMTGIVLATRYVSNREDMQQNNTRRRLIIALLVLAGLVVAITTSIYIRSLNTNNGLLRLFFFLG